MITLFIVGSIVGGALMGAFSIIKFLTYRDEVQLLKETVERLEKLNANLLYKSLTESNEYSF